jgi:hypothetical protein
MEKWQKGDPRIFFNLNCFWNSGRVALTTFKLHLHERFLIAEMFAISTVAQLTLTPKASLSSYGATTLIIKGLYVSLSISDAQHKCLSVIMHVIMLSVVLYLLLWCVLWRPSYSRTPSYLLSQWPRSRGMKSNYIFAMKFCPQTQILPVLKLGLYKF